MWGYLGESWNQWFSLFKLSYWSPSPWDSAYYGVYPKYNAYVSDSAILHRRPRYGRSLDYG